jgi:hypothetical protein
MLINKNIHGYSRKKRHITGRGFVDMMSSVFNSLKSAVGPTFRNIASYVLTNKDLIAKPLLGAVGSLAAKGLSEGVPALISHIRNKSRVHNSRATAIDPQILEDPKYKEILQSMMSSQPVTNIIGSGVRKCGAGIKAF